MSCKALIPVKGGLGNQMFFFAYSLYLKKKGYKPHFVWFHYLFTKHHHGVELYKVFNLCADCDYSGRLYLFLSRVLYFSKLRRLLGKIISLQYFFLQKNVQSNPYSYDEFILPTSMKKVFFDGFWQNYQYVAPIDEELRKKNRV